MTDEEVNRAMSTGKWDTHEPLPLPLDKTACLEGEEFACGSDDGLPDSELAGGMSMLLSSDSEDRKATPIYSGVVRYFPRALAYVARVSFLGNEKHNPGRPLEWVQGKSTDHLDCVMRHAVDAGRIDPENGLYHDGMLAWRALANLETFLKKLEQQ